MKWEERNIIESTFVNKMQKDRLTPADVISAVDLIRMLADDDETAHSMEKMLWKRILMQMAKENNDLAVEALKTEDIDFSRWFA